MEGTTEEVVKLAKEISPCKVITPLDCFSDGAELLNYRKDYEVFRTKDDGISQKYYFDWNAYPIAGQKYGKDVYLNDTEYFPDVFEGVVGYSQKPKISEDIDFPEILSHGCQRVVGNASVHQIMSQKTLQTTIHLMSADTLYKFHEDDMGIGPLKPIDPNRITYWSKAKASELLEEWLKKVIETVRHEENSSFFSPNFVQMQNQQICEVMIRSLFILGVTGAISMVFAKIFNLSGVLLAGAIFIGANVLIFAAFSIGWAFVLIQQALKVSVNDLVNEISKYFSYNGLN